MQAKDLAAYLFRVMLIPSAVFAESLLPLIGIRITVPYLQRRMVTTLVGSYPPLRPESPIVEQSRVLLPAEALAAIERYRKVKSEPGEPAQIPVESEPKHFVQRFKMSQEEARDLALPSPQPPISFRSDPGQWVPNPHLDVTPKTLRWDQLISLAVGVYASDGPGCSERAYQISLFHALYNIDIPCIMERPVQVTTEGLTVPMGRVDLEVCRRFILELKITSATATNIRKDRVQLQRYLRAYKKQGLKLERAALVYFGNGEVRVVEVAIGGETSGRYQPY